MITAFKSSIPNVQVDALRAARYAPPRAAEALITEALRSDDGDVRYAAVESGLCLELRRPGRQPRT